ncbi:TlpA disulfide reductase family protein [Sphingomonas sp. NFR15]|uniref:TlpA family protein disulfide reductase n=1 Tax=Sphingomonas sp. NFR15 TaxID=1566282 RepID=UPI000889116E|nr:TlpA disulfide reductase family protein [Sphingomonas sp. NFR15]SDA16039.1 Peroxiredoxin [Sphingomonas sp. NFR15]
MTGTSQVFRHLALVLVALASIGAKAPEVGGQAPPFELTLVDGTKVSSADLRGQVVVLNFWATWCVPCKQELPTLDAYYAVTSKYGLRVFAVTTEDSVPLSQLKRLFAAMHIAPVRKVRGPYATMSGVPTNYVIDRTGRLRYARAGAFDLDALNALLIPLLKEPAPPAAAPTT